MLEVVIGNSYSQVKGLDSKGLSALKKVLSYEVDAQTTYFSGSYGPRRKYLIDAKGFFPTGLLHRVSKHLRANHTFKVTDTRRVPPMNASRITKGEFTPYPDQLRAVEHAVEADRGIISMPTGTGKSAVIMLLIRVYNLKTLIVVPSLEIKKQIEHGLKEAFGNLKNIIVENIDSAAIKKAKDFDLLIIDECHHAAAKTYHKLNKSVWSGIYHRFFLTATPFRNNEDEQMLFEAIAGNVIFRLSYANAVARGYIVPVEAYVKHLPKVPNNYFTWAEVYSNLIVNNDYRNGYISGVLQSLEAQDKSTLCLVKEIKHGQILSELSGVPFANGQDEESREYITKFNKGEIKALIGTTGILGEGVDTKPAEYIIIAGLGKAKSAFMQQVGRGVRRFGDKESCKVFLFKDASHKFTSKHYATQAKILREEYGVEPIKLGD